MKITRILKVSAKEFYDFLEAEVKNNVYLANRTTLRAEDITKGVFYTKKEFKNFASVEVTILAYKRNEIYKAQLKSSADIITITYETSERQSGLEVNFTQHIASFEEKKHNKFMRIFSEIIYFGRMSDALFDLQKKIISRRENNY